MKTIEPYVKRWYDELDRGVVQGSRCEKCGTVQVPPLPICNECGCCDVTWFSIEGKGELYTIDDCQMPMWGPEYGPVLSGLVRLAEDAVIQVFVVGASEEERAELFDRLPVSVTIEIQERDGYRYPAARIVKEQTV